MKKVVIAILIAFVVFPTIKANATNRTVDKEIKSLVEKYENERGFESINIGSFALNLLRSVAALDTDADDKRELEALKGIKSMLVVDYSDMSASKINSFNHDVKRILGKEELIMEAKDDGDVVYFYGHLNDRTNMVSDIIMYTPTDAALICFLGSVSLDLLIELSD